MADIEILRTHALGLAGAREAAEHLKARLGKQFGLRGAWEGDTLRFERAGLSGTLALTEDSVRLSVALGFMLKAMKASIERAVVDELDTVFSQRKGPSQ